MRTVNVYQNKQTTNSELFDENKTKRLSGWNFWFLYAFQLPI